MGDIVFNGAELMETKKKDGIAKWEGFLQKMALRVLLVEADDSTRQIITALLRKSNYRVTAVLDGLKAWEVLKRRPRNFDLILTEVDLPSISGFALLSLIMEDEMCKNIPIIMMSLQDSVSTVYKCMMRGAADYLVKPVRINELRNLWQHVWRRKFSTVRCNVTQEESVGQQKIEGTFENDAASTHSTGSMACIQKKGECIEKGSDEQSSGTKPDFESESVHVEDMPEVSRQLRGKSLWNAVNLQNQEPCLNYGQKSFMNESEAQDKSGSEVAAYKETTTRADLAEDIESGTDMKDGIVTTEVCNVRINSPRHVIDFMSAFSNRKSHSNIGASNYDSSPHLDLSLRRNHPDCFENQELERKFSLRPSDGSAFSRYTNTPREPLQISLNGCNRQKEFKTDSERSFSNIITACNSETHVATITTQRSVNSLATDHHSKKSVLAAPSSQERLNPVTLSVKLTNRNNLCSRYSPASPQTFCSQSGLSKRPSPSLASQKEPTFQLNPVYCANAEHSNAAQNYDQCGEHAIDSTNNTVNAMDHKLDSQEDWGPISSATDQNASSSFCKGARSRLNGMGYGSACGSSSNVHQVSFGKAASESKNEECFFPSSGSSHQSQREAALSKFRLKRKERCYEKKVRYESRKKLAEQRPRVKGQFVRQEHTEMQHAEFENHCGNSTDVL